MSMAPPKRNPTGFRAFGTGKKPTKSKKPLSEEYLEYKRWIEAGRPGGIFKPKKGK
jgi:hypothetical protein